MLKQTVPTNILYQKTDGAPAEKKFILPIRIPSHLVYAVDLDGLSEQEVEDLVQLHVDHQQYIDGIIKSAFKFEDWVEHTTGTRPTVKWRSYHAAKIVECDVPTAD